MADYCLYCMTQLEENGFCPVGGASHSRFASEPHHIKPGTLLAERYLIGRVLGESAFGITYIAADTKTGARSVVKEYYPKNISARISGSNVISFSGSRNNAVLYEKGKSSFLKNARVLEKAQLPDTVTGVCGHFEANNTAYSVSEYVSGDDLAKVVEARGKLKPEDLFRMMGTLFRDIDAIHANGMLHRDISPENMISDNGRIKLIDIAVAEDRAYNGTDLSSEAKHYCAAPEQYTNSPLSARSDIYSLAASIYFCLTGYKPERASKRLEAECLTPPTRFGARISPQQEDILLKAMSLSPENRYDSAEAFRAEFLEAAAKPVAPPARPAAAAAPVTPINNSKKKKFIIGGIVAAAVIILMTVLALTSGNGKIDTHPGDQTTKTSATSDTTATASETVSAPPEDTKSPESDDTTHAAETRDTEDPEHSGTENEEDAEETSGSEEEAPVTAATTRHTVTPNSEFTVKNGVLTGYSGSGGSITIPSNVKTIGNNVFEGYESITAVTIPENVTAIGEKAFSKCSHLKQVAIGEGVTTIGNYAFNDCKSITKITLPSRVSEISPTVFSGCLALSEINVRSGNQYLTSVDGVLFNADKTTLLIYPRNRAGAYYEIPSTVKTIGAYAFTSSKYIKEITVPASVKTIGNYAFYKCASMTAMRLTYNVTKIGSYAFSKCSKISNIVIGKNIKSIGENAFQDCDSLTQLFYKGSPSAWDKVSKGEFGKHLLVVYNYK